MYDTKLWTPLIVDSRTAARANTCRRGVAHRVTRGSRALHELLEGRRLLAASVTRASENPFALASQSATAYHMGPTAQTSYQSPVVAADASGDATLTLQDQSQSYATLPSTTVTMTGKSELHITGATSPVTGSVFNLNSSDSWLFFENIKPSVVNSTYRSQIFVNGAAATLHTNVRIVEYGVGAVVIPQASTFQPLTTYTGPNFTGTAKSYSQYTIYNTAAELSGQFKDISSFKLKRGYMATVATKTDGTGSSKVYIAADNDLDISILPSEYENSIQFIRVLPWRWVAKKGASDLSATTLNAQWYYNWNNNSSGTLDAEYVPIRQQLYWPGLPSETQQDVTHLSGFNEPNNPAEDAYTTLGNGNVDNAVAFWPQMEATGLRLGAPAVSDSGKSWLYSFMDKALAAGMRVDYIPIHMYMAGQTATSLYNWLKDVWDRYHKPIWVTEFNNGANWTSGTDPTYDQNASVIDSFIQMMDDTPWIERYSVYSRVEAVRQMTYDGDGSLTPAGVKYYNNQSPIAYVQEPVPDANTGSRSVARLPMDGNLLDASGFGNNGQANGAISYVAGQRGQAALFDGTSSYVRLPENVANGSAFTFAAWINWDGGANWQRIFDFGDSTNAFAYLTPSNGTKLRFSIKNGGGEQAVETNPLPVGQWTHVAVTLSGSNASLYVNGALAATNNAVTIKLSDVSPANNYLGKSQFTTDPLFKGRLDDVQVADVALTGAQIAALMNDTAPQFSTTTLARGPAIRGLAFSSSIAGTATDADAGDSITYGKASGPAWLSVGANGALTGTPSFDDSGPQEFVVTATDASGMTSYAVLTVALGETYWRGDVNNNWSTNSAGNTNWATGADGATDTGTLPTASSDIVFSAGNATNLPTTTLGAATSVRSIRVSGSTGVTIGGTQSLTIGAGGLGVEAGAGTTTINTSGGVVLGSSQTWTNDSVNNLIVTSLIGGAATLTKDGTGTLILTGNNTFVGPTLIAGGTLQIGNGGTSGSLTSDIANSGALVVNRSNDVTLSGTITGTGTLTKLGAGRLTLTSVNSFSGSTTIGGNQGAGVVRVTASGALGTGSVLIGPAGNGTTARLELSNNVTIANAISIPLRTNSSAAVENISGNNALSGTITLNVGGSIGIFQSDAGLLTLGAITTDATGSRIPTLTGSGNGLVNGVISNGTGTLGITKTGTGTWTLSAVNTYTGATTVSAGTLAIGGAERIANASPLTLGGGTLATNGYSETLGTITLSANSGLNFGSGAGTLTFSGIGTLTAGTALNVTNWTQGADHLFIGTSATLTAAQLGQIRFNGTAAQQLSTGEIVPLTSSAPTIAVAAAADPNPVTGTSATLSILGADDGGEANLTYSWSVLTKPSGAADPTFSVNGTNAAKNSVITFTKAGTYALSVSVQDGSGLTTTSSVNVVVNPIFTGIAAASGTIASGTSISVGGADQFGGAMSLGSSASWSSNVGSITQNGVFTAPTSGATSATISATVGSTTYTTTVAIAAGRGWYKADATGSSLIDSSGAGNHGTLSGAYTYGTGKAGTALSLSGGAASLPAGIVGGLTDFTFAAWVYLNSSPSWARIFDFGSGTTSNMFLTNNAGGSNILRFAITTSGNGAEQRIDAPAIPTGVWTHVAVSIVGDVGTIYVNGVAAGTNTSLTLKPASLGNTTNNYLGDSQYTADPAFLGSLDDIRILGSGLNAAGIGAVRDEWQAPTVANQAAATPTTVDGGTSATLNVLGASAAGEGGLTYTWSVVGTAPGSVSFDVNGTNAAKNAVATFGASGTYQLLVTISNALGASTTSAVTVPVTLPTPAATVSDRGETYGVASHTLHFTFDRDVGDQDWANLISITSTDGTRTITPSSMSYVAGSQTLTATLPAASTFSNGNYVATLSKGTFLSDEAVLPFFMLAGDADHNRTVDFNDLLTLAKNYNGTGKTYEQGDFTGDGTVDFNDLLLLAKNYNATVPTSSAASTFLATDAADATPATRTRRPVASDVV